MAGFQFGRGLGKRIAEIVEYYAVENDAERIGFVAQLRWCGCNTRRQILHCQSWTISNFLRRVPLRVSRLLPQYGQSAGGLTVCGTRWACASEVAIRRRWLHFTTSSARHGFWRVSACLVAWLSHGRGLVERRKGIGSWRVCDGFADDPHRR